MDTNVRGDIRRCTYGITQRDRVAGVSVFSKQINSATRPVRVIRALPFLFDISLYSFLKYRMVARERAT